MRKILLTFVSVLLFTICCPGHSAFAADMVRIEKTVINARSGPGETYSIVQKLKKDEIYEVEKEENGWFRIKITEQTSAWVAGWVVSGIKKSESNTKSEKATVAINGLNMRSGPGTSYSIEATLPKGTVVRITEEQGEWLKISHKDRTGWVHSDYLESGSPEKEEAKENKYPYVKITASDLTARSKASSDSKKVASLKKGETYEILKTEGYWYQLKISGKKKGWVPKWFTETNQGSEKTQSEEDKITILHDEVPLRKTASLQSSIVKFADAGDEYKVVSVQNGMYEVKLSWGRKAFVAGWLAEASNPENAILKDGSHYSFEDKIIVIDPGHGGNDSGTIGANGTFEKDLTSATASLLKKKLEASGATVFLTRSNDQYVSLSNRVKMASLYNADAFISLHYDSSEQEHIRGITTYYYHSFQNPLAEALDQSFKNEDHLEVRDARFGDYHVLRSNSHPAVLLELGYLSNPEEETAVTSISYQSDIVRAIYNGLGKYYNLE